MLIAYVFVGPQDLPKVARWFARLLKRFRSLISEIKTESGWEDFMKETQEVQEEITGAIEENRETVQKSLSGVKEEIEEANQELSQNIEEAKKDTLH